jgi:hypothetical protein
MLDQGSKDGAALIVREFLIKRMEVFPECQVEQILTILQVIVLQVLR